ncbi:MAG: glycosyltransferase family 2 protein, partial [Bradyrhizobium sp.]|nr:glycosyltransferase family 2 protein [Bradyrhizobium sp.]
MTITAAISTKNRLPSLGRCLESLCRQTRPPDEVVVIDADSDPEVEKLVRAQEEHFSAVGYHALPSSLTQARNHAIRSSRGDIVIFIDDDLVLEPGFIDALARPMEADPEIAGCTGNIIDHPRERKGFNRALKYFFQLPYDGDGRFRLSGAPTTTCGLAGDRAVEFVPGGLTAWRREV